MQFYTRHLQTKPTVGEAAMERGATVCAGAHRAQRIGFACTGIAADPALEKQGACAVEVACMAPTWQWHASHPPVGILAPG